MGVAMQDESAIGSLSRKKTSRIHRHIGTLTAVQLWTSLTAIQLWTEAQDRQNVLCSRQVDQEQEMNGQQYDVDGLVEQLPAPFGDEDATWSDDFGDRSVLCFH